MRMRTVARLLARRVSRCRLGFGHTACPVPAHVALKNLVQTTGGSNTKGGMHGFLHERRTTTKLRQGGQTKQGNRTKSPTDAVYLHTCSRVYLTIRFPTRPRRYRALSLALHCAPSQPLVALADPLGTSKGALKTPRARRTSSTAAQLISARTRPRPKPTPLLCRPVYCVYFTSLC